jgi:hypothetical protein
MSSGEQSRNDDLAGLTSILVVTVLVFEFLVAMWIRGIMFSAVLFGSMSAIFGLTTLLIYSLNRRGSERLEPTSRRRAALASVLLIALVSSACIALLAGIFSLPLLFNGRTREPRQWRVPSVLGLSRPSPSVTIHFPTALASWNAERMPS